MPWLASLPCLRDLTLQGVPQEWPAHAPSLTALRALHLIGYNVNGSAPRLLHSGLTRLSQLTSLQVRACPRPCF